MQIYETDNISEALTKEIVEVVTEENRRRNVKYYFLLWGKSHRE